MALLGQRFDATQVEPSQPFSVIPAGQYRAHIIASEMRTTSRGDGRYLWLCFSILDGEYANRQLYPKLNIENSSDQAREIAERELSALCHAAGKLAVSDSEELHFIPVLVTVRVRPAGEGKDGKMYSESNEVRGFAPVNGKSPVVIREAARQQTTPAARPPYKAPTAAAVNGGETAWQKTKRLKLEAEAAAGAGQR